MSLRDLPHRAFNAALCVFLSLVLALSGLVSPLSRPDRAEAFAPVAAAPAAVGYGLVALLGVLGVSTASMNAGAMAQCWEAFTSDVDAVMDMTARATYEFCAGAAADGVDILANAVEVTQSDIDRVSDALAQAARDGLIAFDDWAAMVSGQFNVSYFIVMAFAQWLLDGGCSWSPVRGALVFDYYGLDCAVQPFPAFRRFGDVSLLGAMSFCTAGAYSGSALDYLMWETPYPDQYRISNDPSGYDSYYFPVAKNALYGQVYFAQMDFATFEWYISGEAVADVCSDAAVLGGWPYVSFPDLNMDSCPIFVLDFGSLLGTGQYHNDFFCSFDDMTGILAHFSSSQNWLDDLVTNYGFSFEPYFVSDNASGWVYDRIVFPALSSADLLCPAPHASDTFFYDGVGYSFFGAVSCMLDWNAGTVTDNPDVLPERQVWGDVADVIGAGIAGAGLAALGSDAVMDGGYIGNRGQIAFPPVPIDNPADSAPFSDASSWADVLSTSKAGVSSGVWAQDVPASATTSAADIATGAIVTDAASSLLQEGAGSSISSAVPVPVPPLFDFGKVTEEVSGKFPFCLPGDLHRLLSVFAAEPAAPAFDWQFWGPRGFVTYRVDLAPFAPVAAVCRWGMLVSLLVGLVFVAIRFIGLIRSAAGR